jgi:hypothetical protein
VKQRAIVVPNVHAAILKVCGARLRRAFGHGHVRCRAVGCSIASCAVDEIKHPRETCAGRQKPAEQIARNVARDVAAHIVARTAACHDRGAVFRRLVVLDPAI